MDSRARLKRWMTLVGLAGLAAGIPLGVVLSQTFRQPLVADSPWLLRFKSEFDLSTTQLHQVRRVLAVQEREIVKVYIRMGQSVPPELSEKVDRIKQQADERIQAALDTAQLDRYMKARQMADPASK